MPSLFGAMSGTTAAMPPVPQSQPHTPLTMPAIVPSGKFGGMLFPQPGASLSQLLKNPMGTRAANPTQNQTTPSNSIASSMQAPQGQQPQPQQPVSAPATTATALQPTMQPAVQPQGLITSLIQNSQIGSPMAGAAAGGLMNIGAQGSPLAQGYAALGAGYGAQSIPISQQAQDIANQFGQKYAQVGQQGAGFESGQLTTGTSPVAQGNAAITAQTTAAKQQALAQGEQAALQGIGYQLTGQQQAANAANQAAGTALTSSQLQQGALNQAGGLGISGQTLLQSGLQNAAGLIPSPLLYGAFGGAGSNLAPNQYLPSLAQQVQQGLMSPQDANAIASSIYGGAGPAMLNQSIQGGSTTPSTGGGGYSYVQGEANANAQQQALSQNVSQGYALQNAANSANQQLGTLQNFYNQLSPFMTGGIPVTNDIAQFIGSKLGSTAAAQYQSALTDARNQVLGVLTSTGMTATDAGQAVQTFLPDGMTPNQLQGNISALQQFMNQRLSAYTQPSGAPQYGGGGYQVPTGNGTAAAGGVDYNF